MGVSYLSRFRLEREPFSQQVEDDFFFADATLVERMDTLAHLVEFGTQILLIIGVRGSGKTTLLQQFLARDDVNCQAYRIRANATLQEQALLRAIALTRDLAGRQRVDKMSVLAIDDAHELPRSSMQAILSLWELGVDPRRSLRVVLAGEPQLKEMLSACLDPIIVERSVYAVEMLAYGALQTGAYLRHRMEVAGFQDALPFTPNQIKRIHKVSHGIPAKINEHAHQLLLQTDAQEARGSAHATSRIGRYTTYLAFGILAAVLLSAAWYFRNDPTDQFRDQQFVQVDQKNPLALSAKEEDKLETESEQHIAGAAEHVGQQRTIDKPIVAQVAVLPERREEAKDIQELAGGSANDPGVTVDDNTPPGSVTKLADGALREVLEPDPEIEETPMDLQMTSAQSLKVDTEAVDVMPVDAKPAEASGLAPAETTHLKPQRSQPKTAEGPTQQGALLSVKDEVWLLHRNPAHYTLQLIAARQEEAVLAYVKRYMRSGQVATFHSYFEGGDWYSLVYGIFPTRFAAEKALRQLPDAVQKEGPWVRSIVSVQNAMKAPIPIVPPQ